MVSLAFASKSVTSTVIASLLFACVISLATVNRALGFAICNAKLRGQFKCECMEGIHSDITVNCSANDFDRIPSDAFPIGTTKLTFRYNNIDVLHTNDFLSAVNVRDLDLAYNSIEVIQPNAFRGLQSLSNLSLRHNWLSRIESSTFTHLVNLVYVDLRDNAIYSISSDAFYFMPRLIKVDLSGLRLQCDCETKALRTWAVGTEVLLVGVTCANFIKDRHLMEIPDDQFGLCQEPSPQTCTLCSGASSLVECNKSEKSLLCQSTEVCQVNSYVTSGHQVVNSSCREASECVSDLQMQYVHCVNGKALQRCSFCCKGPNCNKRINLQGYTYKSTVVIGFTLMEQFDPVLLRTDSKQCQDLSTRIVHQFRDVLSSLGPADLKLEHFKPSPENQTTVTLMYTSVWELERSVSSIQETVYRKLNSAILYHDIQLSLVNNSLMVYLLGFCEEDLTVHKQGKFLWPDTALGTDVRIKCPWPGRTNGMAKRTCISVWHEEDLIQSVTWSDPDVSECAIPSGNTDKLKTLADSIVTNNTVKAIIKSLRQLSSDDMTTTDIEYTSLTLDNILASGVKLDTNTSRGILATYSNLMSVDIDLLRESQKGFNSIERTMKILDSFSSAVLDFPSEPLIEGQISVGLASPNRISGQESTFHIAGSDQMEFRPETVSIVNSSRFDVGLTVAALTVPTSVVHNHNVPVQFVAFTDDILFRAMTHESRDESDPMRTTTDSAQFGSSQVNSIVMAASFGTLHLNQLAEPVVITFRHKIKTASSPRCVFWDFESKAWSSEGCHVTNDATNQYTVCECDHVTNFALIMDIYGDGTDIGEGHKKALNIISYVGCCISLTALTVTLVAYSVSSKLRKDNPSKLLMNLCVSLGMVMIFFIVVTQPTVWNNAVACKVTAVILHYFLLSTWMWMAVEAFYMYLALIKIFKTYISRFILKCCLFGWGVPAVIVIITLSVDTDNYGLQGDICWLARKPFFGACLAPIVLIMVGNFVIFAMVLLQLRRLSARNDKRSGKQQYHYGVRRQLRGALAVLVLLGLTWVFAVFAVDGASLLFQYLFCVFNSFQGLFIFVFYCALKKDVRDIWRMKWTEFTSSVSTSSERTSNKGDKFLSSPIGSTHHTTTDSPKITTILRRSTADQSTLTGSREPLSTSGDKPGVNVNNLLNESET